MQGTTLVRTARFVRGGQGAGEQLEPQELVTMWDLIMGLLKYLANNWIAVLALVVALTTLYLTQLRSFSPDIRDSGRVVVTKNPYDITKSAFMVDFIFSNRGARTGVIDDVALSVQSPSGRTSLFRSFSEITDRTLQYTKDLLPIKSEPFIAFTLKGSDSLVKRILFVPHDPETDPGLMVGEYKLKVYAVTSKDERWRDYDLLTVALDQTDLDVLNQITSTPQADGRSFINWKTRDKVTKKPESRLKLLEKEIGESK